MENELVSVINEYNIDLLENLIDDVENENIYKFTTEDDVLDLLEEGVKGTVDTKQLKRRCSAASGKNKWTTFYYIASGIEVQVRYFRAGIYYSLFAACQNLGPTTGGQKAYVSMNIDFSYKRCGRKESTKSGARTVSRRGVTSSKYRYRLYEGTKRLTDFDLDTDFVVDFYNFYGDFIITRTATLRIVG